jgi:hypothetical protein
MSFVAKTGSWNVAFSNDKDEEYEIAWIQYNNDEGEVQVQFADEDVLSFNSPEQFEALFAQVMTAVKAAFDQNKGRIQ